jgi:hypothetical protein
MLRVVIKAVGVGRSAVVEAADRQGFVTLGIEAGFEAPAQQRMAMQMIEGVLAQANR